MRVTLRCLLLVIVAAIAPTSTVSKVCTPLSEFLAAVPLLTPRHSLYNWTSLLTTLDSMDLIGFMIAPTPSTFLIPSDAAVAALQTTGFGAEAGTGAAVANISGWEADRLLALVYYHVIPGQPSPAALAAAGTADTYLDQLTSGGETLSFSGDGSRLAVSGRVLNNSAVMPNATLGYPCSAVYVIDTVLLPAATLSEIPPFSAIEASLGIAPSAPSTGAARAPEPDAAAPAPGTRVFDLPMAPGPAAIINTTGPSISAPEALSALNAYNDNMSSPTPAPASAGTAPALAMSSASLALKWQSPYLLVVSAALVAFG